MKIRSSREHLTSRPIRTQLLLLARHTTVGTPHRKGIQGVVTTPRHLPFNSPRLWMRRVAILSRGRCPRSLLATTMKLRHQALDPDNRLVTRRFSKRWKPL